MSVVPVVLAAALAAYGIHESRRHDRTIRRIPIRVHVNGTRGKSSVTRLIAGGLRAGGILTFAKTTGTMARMIRPDGSEVDVFRVGSPNIIEQTPDQVSKESVTTYIQAAQTGQNVLKGLTIRHKNLN